ncbi:MAG: sugar-binding protein [bacterium]
MTGCSTIGKQTDETSLAPSPVFAIPRIPAVVVDGNAADWGDGGFRVEALIPDQGAAPARQDCAASLRLGWNDNGLLVLLDVTGHDWSEADKVTDLFGRDSVEFYLAQYPGSADRCQWVVAPGMDARFPDVRVNLQDFATAPKLRRNAVAPDAARQRTDTGYRLELLLPWRTLGITPKLGDEVAFQVMVNSHERKGRPADHLLWFPITGAAFDSRKLHRLQLAEKPAPPITARAQVRVNLREAKTECDVFAPASAAGQTAQLRSIHNTLASGTLITNANGYASVRLTAPGTDDAVVYLDVNQRLADVIPLDLPRAEMAIESRVQLESSATGLAVVIRLPMAPPPGYDISRRLPPDESWQVLARNVAPGEFRDTGVAAEKIYEYAVTRKCEGAAVDYFCSGSAIPLRDRRGTLLLLVERAQAEPLAAEIRQLMFDLVGDGWQVTRKDVDAAQPPAEIRKWIRAEYDRSSQVNTVLLLGHVPVPYAGNFCPDGHGDHAGAWPADVYYGAIAGDWTDATVSNRSNGIQCNVPGDGKPDQSQIPGSVQLAVGRIDFTNLPAFRVGETILLRRYLARDHAYRQAQLPVAERALIHDGFFGQPERFAYSGWQNFTTLLQPEHVRSVTWPNTRPGMNLFFYACGPGHPTSMQGFGATSDLVNTPVGGIFTLLFGSYFGDWNMPDNVMRAALAHENGALTCGWAGRPHWYLHSMGMGETIGDCLRRTQNNSGRDYQPTGAFAQGTHIALLGDPTLRLHRVAPPTDVRVQAASRGQRLSWATSPQQVAGYHVYRADDEFGPYERLTTQPITSLTFDDPTGTAKQFYQVRAMVLQKSTTGSYYNTSQGAFAGK